MDTRARARRGGLAAVAVIGTAVVLAAMASMLLRGRPLALVYELYLFQSAPSAAVLFWMGWLVLSRRPGHGAGRVLLAIGVVQAVHAAAAALLDARLAAAGVDLARDPPLQLVLTQLPADVVAPLVLLATVWVPVPVLAVTMLTVLFPDGRLPGRRWWLVPALAAAGTALLVAGFALALWPVTPWAETGRLAGEPALAVPGGLAVAVASGAGVTALVRRWRRAGAGQRWQFRTVGFAAAGFAVVTTVTYPWAAVWTPASLVAFNLLVVAYGLAVARYRLHDLEPVLGRTAVGAVLAGLVAAVYLVIVVGVGSLVGRGVESALLPLVAVGVVALLIEPARRRVRRLVDRLLYRRHADRADVLSRLAARASTSAEAEDVLGEVARLLLRSTGAARAEVWQAVAPAPRLAAAAGAREQPEPVRRTDVVHQGEPLGELRLYARAAADLTPDADEVLSDVAHALGVVLRNARLAAQLRARLDELQRSRQRLVEVHDRARRGLERDIHDGAQARLISLRLRLGVAQTLAGDATALGGQLDALAREVDAAVRSLRQVTRGLYPPILEQSGIVAALRAHVRDLAVPVVVAAEGAGRYPQPVEAAVYFACLEAIQNAVRHGEAAQVRVTLERTGSGLRFQVTDDGSGFAPGRAPAGTGLTNIHDRIGALGGWVEVDSRPGAGARVRGELPVQPLPEDR